MTKLKVVLDTNVYLSGIIFGGNSRHILDLAIENKITIFTSPSILLEVSEKLNKKFKWNEDQIITVIKAISKTAEVIKPQNKLKIVKSDPSDNKIIEAAVEGNTEYIVSGDKHLLDIKQFRSIQIVSPSQFLSIYLDNTK